jgi:hypothetical protein
MQQTNKKDIIFDHIESRKRKNVKSDFDKKVELLEIDVVDEVADILVKKKITREEKQFVDEYLKKQIKYSYDIENFDNTVFLNLLNLYLYGIGNSLTYFKSKKAFIEKDILIKLTLYKNILESFSTDLIKNYIRDDIDNINTSIEELSIDKEIVDLSDNLSTLSYKSSISNSIDLIERDKDIIEIENYNLQKKYETLDIKYNKIMEDYNKLKKDYEKIEKRNKILSKLNK